VAVVVVVVLIQRIQEKMVLLVVVENGMEPHQEFLVDLEMFQQPLHHKEMLVVQVILQVMVVQVAVAAQALQEAQDQEQTPVVEQVEMA